MSKCRLAAVLTASVSMAAMCTTAKAQGVEAPPAAAEIVVTAQKRSEKLSDVPLSITAASGEQLANAGVSAPSDC